MSCSCIREPRDSGIVTFIIDEICPRVSYSVITVYILNDGKYYLYLDHKYDIDESISFKWQYNKKDHICPQDWTGIVPQFRIDYPKNIDDRLLNTLTTWYLQPSANRYRSDWYNGSGEHLYNFEIDKLGNTWFFAVLEHCPRTITKWGNIFTNRNELENYVDTLLAVYGVNKNISPNFKQIVSQTYIKRDLIPLLPNLLSELPPPLRGIILEYAFEL